MVCSTLGVGVSASWVSGYRASDRVAVVVGDLLTFGSSPGFGEEPKAKSFKAWLSGR